MYRGFSEIYSPQIVDKICECSKEQGYEVAYRRIDHALSDPLSLRDFLPSIMARNNGVMPPHETQNRKTSISNFSCSFFAEKETLLEAIALIPSERNDAHCLAMGSLLKHLGRSDDPDSIKHINHYIFDPANTNYWNSFTIIYPEETHD